MKAPKPRRGERFPPKSAGNGRASQGRVGRAPPFPIFGVRRSAEAPLRSPGFETGSLMSGFSRIARAGGKSAGAQVVGHLAGQSCLGRVGVLDAAVLRGFGPCRAPSKAAKDLRIRDDDARPRLKPWPSASNNLGRYASRISASPGGRRRTGVPPALDVRSSGRFGWNRPFFDLQSPKAGGTPARRFMPSPTTRGMHAAQFGSGNRACQGRPGGMHWTFDEGRNLSSGSLANRRNDFTMLRLWSAENREVRSRHTISESRHAPPRARVGAPEGGWPSRYPCGACQ
jgi:hypothetical protein